MENNPKNLLFKLQQKFIQGHYIEVENSLKNLIDIDANEKLLFLYAMSLLKQNNFLKAEIQFQKLLKLNDQNLEVYFQLGICLRAQNKITLAIEILNKASKIQLNKVILLLLANIYRDLGRFEESLITIKNAIEIAPDFDESYIAMANIYADLGNYKEAKKSINNLIIQNNEKALTTYSYILLDEGNLILAKKILNKLLEINDQNTIANFNLAIIHLSEKNYKVGWEMYESRFDLVNYHLSKKINGYISKPRWNEKYPKKKILVWGEQGIGDQILFSKYIDVILNDFEKIILCVTEKLTPFFKEIYPQLEIKSIKEINNHLDFDYHIPMSSLGLYFQNKTLEIKPHTINESFLCNKIPKKHKKIRIGLSWFSNSGVTANKKSISLEMFEELFNIDDIEFINLQYTDEITSITNLEKKVNKKIFLDHKIDCFNNIFELASLMKSCDLIITVSNSNAHIAGKLGIKTFIVLPHNSGKFWYWRTQNKNNFSDWYPSIEIFKANENFKWDDVIQRLLKRINLIIAKQKPEKI